jgi:hypothetical protein
MGPRCSSAETQVCHRSYIIAARKKRFNCLHVEIRMQPERVCKIIMTCAVLHNIAIEMKEPMDDVDRTRLKQ